jgi:hypothetical protein
VACSAVPQSTAPPRAPIMYLISLVTRRLVVGLNVVNYHASEISFHLLTTARPYFINKHVVSTIYLVWQFRLFAANLPVHKIPNVSVL